MNVRGWVSALGPSAGTLAWPPLPSPPVLGAPSALRHQPDAPKPFPAPGLGTKACRPGLFLLPPFSPAEEPKLSSWLLFSTLFLPASLQL